MATSEEEQAFERGRTEGQIQERLASHDRHFQTINGQLAQVANSLRELTLVVTRVNDRQQAILDTGNATREAVRAASEQRWSRWQRIFAVIATLATVLGAYVAWRALH